MRSGVSSHELLPIRLRWHGRGGQGVVTASRIIAEAALQAGLYLQSLPDFGAERSGAPIAAHTRIDLAPPVDRGPVTDPTMVIVLDPSLIGRLNVVAGLMPGGLVLINSRAGADDLALALQLSLGRIVPIDASAIGERLLGRNLPNVPMVGALASLLPFAPFRVVEEAARSVLSVSLRQHVVAANIEALKEGYAVVSTGTVANHG